MLLPTTPCFSLLAPGKCACCLTWVILFLSIATYVAYLGKQFFPWTVYYMGMENRKGSTYLFWIRHRNRYVVYEYCIKYIYHTYTIYLLSSSLSRESIIVFKGEEVVEEFCQSFESHKRQMYWQMISALIPSLYYCCNLPKNFERERRTFFFSKTSLLLLGWHLTLQPMRGPPPQLSR